jgi:hypothetical protein
MFPATNYSPDHFPGEALSGLLVLVPLLLLPVPLEVPDEPLVPVPVLVPVPERSVPVLVPVPERSLPVVERSELVLEPVLLGCVVDGVVRSRSRAGVPVLFVPVSLLSQPVKAIPPRARAAATNIARCFCIKDLVSKFPLYAAAPRPPTVLNFTPAP